MVATITGEGGSGGALAIAAANKVLMLEHAIYSVAEPEGRASIVFRDDERAAFMAEAMKITAQDLIGFSDHRPDHRGAGRRRPCRLRRPPSPRSATPSSRNCKAWTASPPDALRDQRAARFYAIGRMGMN